MSNYTLQTAQTTLDIVDQLHSRNAMTVDELSEELSMDRTTLYGYLNTLRQSNFIVKEDGAYSLSLKFVGMASAVLNDHPTYVMADAYTARVAENTGMRALFAVEENGKGVIVDKSNGEYPQWPHEKVGVTFFLHSTAAGKILLSGLPESRRSEIFDQHGLPPQTSRTITSVENINSELERVGRTGYAINNQEHIDGIIAIAVPVRDNSGQTVGALAANCPADDRTISELKEDVFEVMSQIVAEYKEHLEGRSV